MSNDPRRALAEAVTEKMDKEWWLETLGGAKKTKTRRIRRTCPGCKRANDYDVEHEQIDLKLVAQLLDQAFGRPAETKKIEVDIRAQTAEEMRELSTDELLQLTAGE